MTSYLMAIVMFAISLAFYEIFVNEIKYKISTLKIKVKVKEKKTGFFSQF